MKWFIGSVFALGVVAVVGVCVALLLLARDEVKDSVTAPGTETHLAVYEGAGTSGTDTVALLRLVGEETNIIAHLKKGQQLPGIGATVHVTGVRVKERGVIRLTGATIERVR